jgi:Tfp pilus assembly protein PilF
VIPPRERPRRVLPRWRGSDDAIVGRLLPNTSDSSDGSSELSAREAEWLASGKRSRGRALDLISVASSVNHPSLVAREAALWLVDAGEPSPLARRLAQRLLTARNAQAELDLAGAESPSESQHVRARVRALRAGLREDPRNALAWAEQARMYTLIGQEQPALDAMKRALVLAPDHRFLLRAAVRLHVHVDGADDARRLLTRHPRTRRDPWLLASEIAVASLTGRVSRHLRAARDMLDDRAWTARDLSELASAVGTVELENDKARKARNLFRLALTDPNDNSLAQAEWAAPQIPGVAVQIAGMLDETPLSFEARSIAAAAASRHAEAVEHGWAWLLDQPFASEPAIFGSYQAALSRDLRRSLDFAVRGLQANPRQTVLLNNAAFALAKMDRVSAAREQLALVHRSDLSPDERAMLLATEGLIELRAGDAAAGEELYRRSIEVTSSPAHRALARIMLASELIRLRYPGFGDLVRAALDDGARNLPDRDRGWLEYLAN